MVQVMEIMAPDVRDHTQDRQSKQCDEEDPNHNLIYCSCHRRTRQTRVLMVGISPITILSGCTESPGISDQEPCRRIPRRPLDSIPWYRVYPVYT